MNRYPLPLRVGVIVHTFVLTRTIDTCTSIVGGRKERERTRKERNLEETRLHQTEDAEINRQTKCGRVRGVRTGRKKCTCASCVLTQKETIIIRKKPWRQGISGLGNGQHQRVNKREKERSDAGETRTEQVYVPPSDSSTNISV